MMIVMAQLERDLVQKKLQKQKQENFFKQISQERNLGGDHSSDEIAALQAKILKLSLPEEAKTIVDQEIKKLR
jgi:ATP-dependent Lon protease